MISCGLLRSIIVPKGGKVLILSFFRENPYAQRLYHHNGYEIRGYADWRKGRFDLMEKEL